MTLKVIGLHFGPQNPRHLSHRPMDVCANPAEDIYLYSRIAVLAASDRERNNPDFGWNWSLFLSGWLPAHFDMVCAALQSLPITQPGLTGFFLIAEYSRCSPRVLFLSVERL
jgi:hypothetical protein